MKRNQQHQEFLMILVIIFVACLVVVCLFGCSTHRLMKQQIALRSDTTINVLRNNRAPYLRVVEVTQPTHGSTRLTGDSSVSILLDKNYSGDDRFTYVVLDSSLKKKQRTRMELKTLPPFVKEFNITLLTPSKDSSESYNLKLLIGNEVIWDTVAGAGQSWLIGRRTIFRATLPSRSALAVDKIDEGKLIVSKEPYTSLAWPPLAEASVVLSNGKSLLILPRTAKPDTARIEVSTWNWSLRKDPFARKEDEGNEFGKGDTVYSVVLGASFDFMNKINIDNLYSNATLYAPNLLGRFGIDAGFFQSRGNTLNDKGEEVDNYRKVSGTDTTNYATRYSVKSSAKIDNLGLYLNPTYRLSDMFDLFLNLEYRHRTVTSTPQYSVIDSGAGQSKDPSFAPHPNSKYSNPLAYQEITNDLLLGPGVTVMYSDRSVDFDASISYTIDLTGGKNMLFQFELVSKPSNFQVGGEIRDVKAFSGASQKEYLIYLAKRYPLSAFSDFFTGKK